MWYALRFEDLKPMVPHHVQFKEAITAKRLAEEAEQERVEAERKAARRKAQAKAEAVRRKQMKHVLFTVPEVPQVGPWPCYQRDAAVGCS
jgi:hypothetical protein